jgi:hypothetical protein
MSAWANTLGIMSASLAMVQYFPQIWTTYNLGHVGSLSLPMMAIQVPGSFLWSGSLFARLGFEGWSTWGVFLVTGCLQACLLIMGTAFELEARKKEHIAESLRVSGSIPKAIAILITNHSRIQTELCQDMEVKMSPHQMGTGIKMRGHHYCVNRRFSFMVV